MRTSSDAVREAAPSGGVSTQEAKAKADATGVSQWSDEDQCWVYPGNMTAADGTKISSSFDSFTEDELRVYKIVTAVLFWIDGALCIFGGVSMMIVAGRLSSLAAYGAGAALDALWFLALMEIVMGSFLFYLRHLLVTFNKSALTWLFRLMVFSIVTSVIGLVTGYFGVRDFLMLALTVGGYFFLKKYAAEHPFTFVNE
ncbi:MAG: hypothetical protein Q4B54_00450 [Coriobacteriales bacterium]|nr:hypothetical protein [Coriobacteriales bacterium]